MNARRTNSADHRNWLAPHLHPCDRNCRLIDIVRQPLRDLRFQLLHGHACRVNPTRQWQRDVTGGANANGLIRDLVDVRHSDRHLIIRAQEAGRKWVESACGIRRFILRCCADANRQQQDRDKHAADLHQSLLLKCITYGGIKPQEAKATAMSVPLFFLTEARGRRAKPRILSRCPSISKHWRLIANNTIVQFMKPTLNARLAAAEGLSARVSWGLIAPTCGAGRTIV